MTDEEQVEFISGAIIAKIQEPHLETVKILARVVTRQDDMDRRMEKAETSVDKVKEDVTGVRVTAARAGGAWGGAVALIGLAAAWIKTQVG